MAVHGTVHLQSWFPSSRLIFLLTSSSFPCQPFQLLRSGWILAASFLNPSFPPPLPPISSSCPATRHSRHSRRTAPEQLREQPLGSWALIADRPLEHAENHCSVIYCTFETAGNIRAWIAALRGACSTTQSSGGGISSKRTASQAGADPEQHFTG